VVDVATTDGLGFFEQPIDIRDITFSGLPGIRYEFSATGGVEQDGRAALWYAIFLDGVRPGGESPVRLLSASLSAVPEEYAADRMSFIGLVGSIEMLDGTTATARESAVGELFDETRGCKRDDAPIEVEFPASWETNAAAAGVPACAYFAPGPFEIRHPRDVPDGVEIVVRVVEGADLGASGDVVEREELTINGWPSVRVEELGVGGGLMAPGERWYGYVIGINGELPSERNTSAYLVISTRTAFEGDYPLARVVLDEMAERLTGLGGP
jgi:hypothetical protein